MNEVDKLLGLYTHIMEDELSKNGEYLEITQDGRSLAGELAKLHEDWNNLQTIVIFKSKDLKIEGKSMMEWYVESMLFVALFSLTKMVLLGLFDSCFQMLRGLVEGVELALGLDAHPEYRNLSVNRKIDVLSKERKKIIKYVFDGLLNEDEKKTLKDMYSVLSEDWIHAFGYFKRGRYEFIETSEFPPWQLYSTYLGERNKEVCKLVVYVKQFREILKAIVKRWQFFLEEQT